MWKTTSSRHFLCTIVQENDPKKSLKILFKTHCRYSGLFLSCILWDSFGIRQYTYIYTNVLVHLFWLTLSLWTITFVLQLHFNYTSTILQLYFNYTSTILQRCFNSTSTIFERYLNSTEGQYNSDLAGMTFLDQILLALLVSMVSLPLPMLFFNVNINLAKSMRNSRVFEFAGKENTFY